MNIVGRIKLLQKEKDGKVSLNALEKRLDIGKSTISSWEKKQPSADKLEKVANYFNVSTDYLLGRTDDPAPPDTVIAASTKPDVENMSTSDLVKFISQASKELEKRTGE